jgi:hypothetical protein
MSQNCLKPFANEESVWLLPQTVTLTFCEVSSVRTKVRNGAEALPRSLMPVRVTPLQAVNGVFAHVTTSLDCNMAQQGALQCTLCQFLQVEFPRHRSSECTT